MLFDAGTLEEVRSVPRVHVFCLFPCPTSFLVSACLYPLTGTLRLLCSHSHVFNCFNFCAKLSGLLHVGEVVTKGSYGCQTCHFLVAFL